MSVRQLILLRHAHAEPALADQDDADRPLGPRGIAEATAAREWLAGHGCAPALVLCSPAVRTRETLEGVQDGIGHPPVRIESRLYEATPATLVRLIDEHSTARSLMLVGHNPGFENLVALLTEGASDQGRGMPTAAVAWLELPDGEVEPGTARLLRFWWP